MPQVPANTRLAVETVQDTINTCRESDASHARAELCHGAFLDLLGPKDPAKNSRISRISGETLDAKYNC